MSTTHHQSQPAPARKHAFGDSLKVALGMAVLLGVFYLLREHWNHVAGNWVYLLLLACPLMHLFHGHGGHGGHGGRESPSNKPADRAD